VLLETKRLRLRQLRPGDTGSLFEILADPETMQFYPAPYSKAEVKDWIERSMTTYPNGYGLMAVELKGDEIFIGQCGIAYPNIDGEHLPEIGYHINKAVWNRGYATEAAQGCMEFGFEQLELPEIFIHTYVENRPSIRVAEKLGMMKRKEFDKHIATHDVTMRHVVFSMKRQDYI